MCGEKKPLGMSELGCADGCVDGKWVRRIARTAADGVGAREWLEMGGEKKPLEISELGCADGCGREMGGENCADGCGRRGCKGVAGNGWGKEAAGDERAWLRGWLRTEMGAENCVDGCGRRGCQGVAGNGWGEEAAGMSELGCADGCGWEMGATEWLEMGGEKNKMQPTNPNAHTYVNGYAVTQNNFLQ